ncbi:MAG: heavy metal translocating P-type ATPase [Chloroflexota bacterium]
MLIGIIGAGTLAVGLSFYKRRKRNQYKRLDLQEKTTLVSILSIASVTPCANKNTQRSSSTWSLLFSDLRHQQMLEMSRSESHELSDAEKKANRNLTVSLASLVITTAGIFYPLLNWLGVVAILYLWFPLGQTAFRSIVKERRLSIEVLDFAMTPIILAMGYYVVTAVSCVTYYISEKLLVKIEDNSQKSIANVFGLQMRSVWVISDGVEVEIPLESLQQGDIVVIHVGETIAVDGAVVSGVATVDQRVLTGESQPVEKSVSEQVYAATMVLSGKIYVAAEKAGEETVAAQIGQILRDTEDFKAFMRVRAVEIADQMVPLRITLTLATLPFLTTVGTLAVLNARFGYHMRLLGPLGMLNFLQIASQRGILIKDGRSLEMLQKVDTVVFDKTGTLTQEQPHVGSIYTCHGYSEEEILRYAAAAEYKQSHPIALAILQKAQEYNFSLPEISDATYEIGYGIKVRLSGHLIHVGSIRFMNMEGIAIPDEIVQVEKEMQEEAHSLVYVALDDQLGGAVELRPTIRPEAKPMIEYLQTRNMNITIISGDHQRPTQKLAEALGVQEYFAETLPENKARIVEQLQQEGKCVCFVGDGINDSIALKKADVSISLRGASTIATDTAQIILMTQNLSQLSHAFELADEFEQHMQKSLLTTIVPQVLCVSGAFFLNFGIVAAMVFNQIGLYTGIANAMSPLFTANRVQIADTVYNSS